MTPESSVILELALAAWIVAVCVWAIWVSKP